MADLKWRRLRAWVKERIAAESRETPGVMFAVEHWSRVRTLKAVLLVMDAESRRARRRKAR